MLEAATMTIRERAKRLKERAGEVAHAARERIHLPRRKSQAAKLFDEAKPVLKSTAPLLATVAVEEFLRRWRGANRKKAMKQEIAPALVGLATAAASNPQVRKIIKDAIDAALPKLEKVVEKAKQTKAAVAANGGEKVEKESLAEAESDEA